MAEHVDVLIVGAGLSGIGAACHLKRECPGKSIAILEGRDAIGGTWDLFRYPGVRSDSDMFTLSYNFRPWTEADAIGGGAAIRQYIHDTADSYGVRDLVRLNHRVTAAAWDSDDARWTVTVQCGDATPPQTVTCDFLWMCTGYYRYDAGHNPPFAGLEEYTGTVVHPQLWPEDLDYTGKRVVVIGSGATAITLVPAMAETAAHVTMLQRSPTYLVAAPGRNRLANALRRRLPDRIAGPAVRWLFAIFGVLGYQLCRRRPQLMKSFLLNAARRQLPEGYDVDTHLTPRYNPWDQRMCLVKDGDMFTAIRDGKVTIVTDTIECFTAAGLRLSSGEELPADIVVTATGLRLVALGDTELTVDGTRVDIGSAVSFKGLMLTGVPNLAWTFGYTNASWTLKADLVAGYVCRLLNHLDANGYAAVTPLPPPSGEVTPFLDLTSGYVQRHVDDFPKQGTAPPWRLYQNYLLDYRVLARGPVDDHVRFTRRHATARAGEVSA
jgi:cation diffusion facilitator CzcD-associated flavoprotein CzcO